MSNVDKKKLQNLLEHELLQVVIASALGYSGI
jgi:hypothetical protein